MRRMKNNLSKIGMMMIQRKRRKIKELKKKSLVKRKKTKMIFFDFESLYNSYHMKKGHSKEQCF